MFTAIFSSMALYLESQIWLLSCLHQYLVVMDQKLDPKSCTIVELTYKVSVGFALDF